jgi:hypothetical protein
MRFTGRYRFIRAVRTHPRVGVEKQFRGRVTKVIRARKKGRHGGMQVGARLRQEGKIADE